MPLDFYNGGGSNWNCSTILVLIQDKPLNSPPLLPKLVTSVDELARLF